MSEKCPKAMSENTPVAVDAAQQLELDLSGAFGDGTNPSQTKSTPQPAKPSSTPCRAKNPETCRYHLKNYLSSLKRMSDQELAAYLKKVDDDKHQRELEMVLAEAKRRSVKAYEERNHGEWL